jgi:Secretion system C-terminal sorting domain
MAFFRCCMVTVVCVFCICTTNAQTVYYPVGSSQLLKATAIDMAQLLQKSIAGANISTQQYTIMPSNGIVFMYDSTINGNQTCAVKSNGARLTFKAPEDNGLVYGVYQYLHKLGYRFYQPGTIWEVIPSLNSAYTLIDTLFTNTYKYKSWVVSGGCDNWVMDTNPDYRWDIYFGENGHNWALYQRRNGMISEYAFAGHRGDIMTASYIAKLQSNPCYVAAYNGQRKASAQSVPDINNAAAINLWSNTIEQNFTSYKNIIQGNPTLYVNQFRNFKYGTQHLGIEVPDAAEWGNSAATNSAVSCGTTNYPSESDQQFLLANQTAQKINAIYPNKKFQVYAYSTHANIPSSSIAINKNIDVQLIPVVYQLETSTNGLRNRWYNTYNNVSEYHYLNLSGWSGETPYFSWNELKKTLQIAKSKKTQGVAWEASPAKFGSLPYLLAATNFLKDGTDVDKTLQQFCNDMFGAANTTIYKMLQMFGSDNQAKTKNKLLLYLQLMQQAVLQTQNETDIVKSRLTELKAYLHYMVMYFDATTNNYTPTKRADKDAALCMYLAKTSKMQLVNSYYLINTISAKYGSSSEFYKKYNIGNGTAYNNGNLPLLTKTEIENDFLQDVATYANQINHYIFNEDDEQKNLLASNNVLPLDKINMHLSYTNGLNYYNSTSFNIIANKANSFTIQYTPRFDNKEKGYINFLVESADETFKVIKDFTITQKNGAGVLKIDLPVAGKYMLTLVSKYQSAVDLTIATNGTYFYKKGTFLSSTTESYTKDTKSLPSFFYVPTGMQKVYFTVGGTFANGKYATADEIGKLLSIKNNSGTYTIKPRLVTPKDSALFYFEIPNAEQGNFWQIQPSNLYSLFFANISNMLWYAGWGSNTKPITPPTTITEAYEAKAYPNPSKGEYACMQNNKQVVATTILVMNTLGVKLAEFKNTNQFNITNLPAGIYFYTMNIDGKWYNGKLVKM